LNHEVLPKKKKDYFSPSLSPHLFKYPSNAAKFFFGSYPGHEVYFIIQY